MNVPVVLEAYHIGHFCDGCAKAVRDAERDRCVSAIEAQRGKVSVGDLSREAMDGVIDWLITAIRAGK